MIANQPGPTAEERDARGMRRIREDEQDCFRQGLRPIPTLALAVASLLESLSTILIVIWAVLVAGNFVGLVVTISTDTSSVLSWLASLDSQSFDPTISLLAGLAAAVFIVFARLLAEFAADLGDWAEDHRHDLIHGR
jgi:hypothetical protein